jgi:hypothetical protein
MKGDKTISCRKVAFRPNFGQSAIPRALSNDYLYLLYQLYLTEVTVACQMFHKFVSAKRNAAEFQGCVHGMFGLILVWAASPGKGIHEGSPILLLGHVF